MTPDQKAKQDALRAHKKAGSRRKSFPMTRTPETPTATPDAGAVTLETMAELLREVVDRGLIYWEPNTSRGHFSKNDMLNRIENALARSPATAPGVPRQPTESMLDAARDWSAVFVGTPIGNEAATGCWQAMWDAGHATLAPDAQPGAVLNRQWTPVPDTAASDAAPSDGLPGRGEVMALLLEACKAVLDAHDRGDLAYKSPRLMATLRRTVNAAGIASDAIAGSRAAQEPHTIKRLPVDIEDEIVSLEQAGNASGKSLRSLICDHLAASAARDVGSDDRGGATFQRRNVYWMAHAFDAVDDLTDIDERRERFAEEAMELIQATGGTLDGVIEQARYTFGRPKGDPTQEAGGTLTTLACLLAYARVDMVAAGEAELARCWLPETIAKVRRKRANRHGRGVLPGNDADFTPAPPATTSEA